MRSLEDLRFIAARVYQEWCVDRQPAGPLLGEREPQQTCQYSHVGQYVQQRHRRVCRQCERERDDRRHGRAI